MRFLALAGLLVLSFAMPPAPSIAGPDGETIRILVPTTRIAGSEESSASSVGWKRLEVPSDGDGAEALAAAREQYGSDVILERVYELDGPTGEPLFEDQWYLENTGQSGGTADADIDASLAWTVATGAGVTVAVVDSGVDASHPDLAGRVVAGWDTVDDDGDPSPVGSGFDEAHGTLVSGVIAAAVNGTGITGVAPGSTILNMRACEGGECWSLDVAEAIYRAVDSNADIVNMSLGSFGEDDPPIESAIAYARSRNVLVVAAAGNGGDDIDNLPGGEVVIPAGLGLENIVSVSASDHRDSKPGFANYGDSVDLFAPGVQILSTGAAGVDTYDNVSGTSFAAPIVSGVAALLLSADPGIRHQELKARLEVFADRPSGLAGFSSFGRVNAGRTLTKRFTDTQTSVFVNAIDWLAAQNITEGCNPPYNYRYCPTDEVTRGEMAVFFARAFGLPATGTDYFRDDDGRFYEGAANRMAAAGITVGCAPDRYCGERDISREEMAAMLARVLRLSPSSQDYFIDDSTSIFQGAINRIAKAGVTQGCNPPTGNRYCPVDKVTRGEMSAFIKRAVSLAG